MPKINQNKMIERRLSVLETLMTDTREDIKNIKDNHLTKIYTKLDELFRHNIDLERKLWQRPGWIISILIGLVIGLSVFIITSF